MAAEKVVSVRLRAITDQFKTGMDQASASVRGFANDTDRVQRAGARMKTAGRSMTVGLTLPIVAAGVAAVKTAVDFDTSMSRIQGLVGLSADEVSGMRDRVLELSGATTKSPQELADALFAITSAGLRGADALTLLEDAGRASAAGMGDTRQIALTATAAMRTFGLSSAEAVDIMVGAVREGNLSAEEMAGAFGKVVQIGGAAGVKFEEIAGLTAFLTRGNVTASEATTQLEQAILALNSPTQEAAASLEAAGGSVEELKAALESGGIVGALEYLEATLGGNDLAMRKALGSSEALAAAQSILGDESGDLQQILDSVADSTGAGADAFDAYADSDGFAAAQAWAELQTSLIELGQQLIPVLSMGADMLSTFAGAFAQLPGAAQTSVVALLGFVAVMGPMMSGVGSLMVAFPGLATAAWAMAGRVRAAMTTMATGHPILLGLTLAIGAAMTAWQLFGGSSDDVSQDVRQLTDAMREQNDVIGENTRAWLENKLAGDDSGAAYESIISAMERVGLTVDDLESALAGGDSAWRSFADSLGFANGTLDEMGDSTDPAVIALEQLRTAFGEAEGRAELLDAVFSGVGTAAGEAGDGMGGAAEDAAAMAEEQQAAAAAAQELADALGPLNVALSKSEAGIASRDAMRGLQDAYADATAEGENFADHADTLEGKVNSVVDAVIAAADANNTMADGSKNAAGAAAETLASLQAIRGFIPAELLPQFDRYIALVEDVPGDATTDVRTPGSGAAQAELANTKARAEAIPPKREVQVDADTKSAHTALDRLLEHLGRISGKTFGTVVKVSTQGIPSAAGGIYHPRSGGIPLTVAEAGYSEVVLSTDPKYQKRNVGLLEASGLMRSMMSPVSGAPRSAGGAGGSGMSPAAFGAAVRTAVSGMTVTLDGREVGNVVTKRQLTASRGGR